MSATASSNNLDAETRRLETAGIAATATDLASDPVISNKRPREEESRSDLAISKKARTIDVELEQCIDRIRRVEYTRTDFHTLAKRLFMLKDRVMLKAAFDLCGNHWAFRAIVLSLDTILSYPDDEEVTDVTPEFIDELTSSFGNEYGTVAVMDCFLRANSRFDDRVPLARSIIAKRLTPTQFGAFVKRLCRCALEGFYDMEDPRNHQRLVRAIGKFMIDVAVTRTAEQFWEIIDPILDTIQHSLMIQAIFGIASNALSGNIINLRKGQVFKKLLESIQPAESDEDYLKGFHYALWAPLQLYAPDSYWPVDAVDHRFIKKSEIPEVDQRYDPERVLEAAKRLGIVDLKKVVSMLESRDAGDPVLKFYCKRIVCEAVGHPFTRTDDGKASSDDDDDSVFGSLYSSGEVNDDEDEDEEEDEEEESGNEGSKSKSA